MYFVVFNRCGKSARARDKFIDFFPFIWLIYYVFFWFTLFCRFFAITAGGSVACFLSKPSSNVIKFNFVTFVFPFCIDFEVTIKCEILDSTESVPLSSIGNVTFHSINEISHLNEMHSLNFFVDIAWTIC